MTQGKICSPESEEFLEIKFLRFMDVPGHKYKYIFKLFDNLYSKLFTVTNTYIT